MTESERARVRKLRLEGAGYKQIASELELSLNTIKSYCRRTLLCGSGETVTFNHLVSVDDGLVCKRCGKRLRHKHGKRRKVFCSDTCRKMYWKEKRKAMIEHIEPKAMADTIAVYCAHDKIVDTDELVAYPIKNSSTVNALVLDPFGGSGSTLIACEQIDRICYTAELDEKFADVIVRRYVDFKGSSDDVFLLRDGVKIPYSEDEQEKIIETIHNYMGQ